MSECVGQWDLGKLTQRRSELERQLEEMNSQRSAQEAEALERLWRRLFASRPTGSGRKGLPRLPASPQRRSAGADRTVVVIGLPRAPSGASDIGPGSARAAGTRRGAGGIIQKRVSVMPSLGGAKTSAAAYAQTQRFGRPATAAGATAFYARTTAVSRTGGRVSDRRGNADRLVSRVEYYTRDGSRRSIDDAEVAIGNEGNVDAKLRYFERAGASIDGGDNDDVLAIITNMGASRALRRDVARAVERAERSLKNGGLNRTRSASAELATTQVYELPHELGLPRLERLIEKFVEPIESEGVFYIAVIHRPPAGGDHRNIHFHLLWTHRPGRFTEDGEICFAPTKTRALRGPAFLKKMRRRFAESANVALAEAGAAKQYFAGSYAVEGLGHIKGGRHLGPAATQRARANRASGIAARDANVPDRSDAPLALHQGEVVLGAAARLAAAQVDLDVRVIEAEATEIAMRLEVISILHRARSAIGNGIGFIPTGGAGIVVTALSLNRASEADNLRRELESVREIAGPALAAWIGANQGRLRRSWDGHTRELRMLFRERYGGQVGIDGDDKLCIRLDKGGVWSKPASWIADVLRKHHHKGLRALAAKQLESRRSSKSHGETEKPVEKTAAALKPRPELPIKTGEPAPVHDVVVVVPKTLSGPWVGLEKLQESLIRDGVPGIERPLDDSELYRELLMRKNRSLTVLFAVVQGVADVMTPSAARNQLRRIERIIEAQARCRGLDLENGTRSASAVGVDRWTFELHADSSNDDVLAGEWARDPNCR